MTPAFDKPPGASLAGMDPTAYLQPEGQVEQGSCMSERVNRFLGGSPLSILIKLVLLSIVVGVILSWLSWSPMEIVDWVVTFFGRLWIGIFGSLDRAIDYFMLGAVIVVPLFLLSRLMKSGRDHV